MIPEYKLYHGSVLADIVAACDGPVAFRSQSDGKRLLNYVINDAVGLQVKYATQRLHPWQFSFTKSHVNSLAGLTSTYRACFVVLVCRTDGMIAIDAKDVLASLLPLDSSQTWLRADRKKREMYRVHGPNGEFSAKFRTTIQPILDALKYLDARPTAH